ncbi:uncharacterized protein E0L32_005707 [Thyridium curvatum]|uniref:Uncharacterized protein n=1 Tax=Thyridium curvatum TaxID=1093900 RepID=A0A507B1K6_9PEZI|nr:uncharacterized protein E0L32_005707 [Thyridium curvatum]TPX13763.1 hypothetical protein E0L32_005707 [Thyridium curvatum]
MNQTHSFPLLITVSLVLPAAQPPPPLRDLADVLQRALDPAVRVVQPAALELDKEEVLEGADQARQAVDARQVQLEAAERVQHVGQRAGALVRHRERHERLVPLLPASSSSACLPLLFSNLLAGSLPPPDDQEARRVVLPVLDAARQHIEPARRGRHLARDRRAAPAAVPRRLLGRPARRAHVDRVHAPEVPAQKGRRLAERLRVRVDALDVRQVRQGLAPRGGGAGLLLL